MGMKIVTEIQNSGFLVEKILTIYQGKGYYRGVVYQYPLGETYKFGGWRKKENILSSANFYEKDKDMSIFRVCEYFGFNQRNTLSKYK